MAWFKQGGSITDPVERSRLYRLGFEKDCAGRAGVPLMTTVVSLRLS